MVLIALGSHAAAEVGSQDNMKAAVSVKLPQIWLTLGCGLRGQT